MEFVGVILGLASVIAASYSIWWARREAGRARTAAEQAREAAEGARSLLGQNITIADLTQASGHIDHLKELHSTQQWQRALDNYTPLRQLIQAARGRHPLPLIPVQAVLQKAIAQIAAMEREVRNSETRTPNDAQHSLGGQLNNALVDIQVNLDQIRLDLAG